MFKGTTETTEIARALKSVLSKIEIACQNRPPELSQYSPRLVAVSKTKSAQQIIDAYNAGQRHFGENYVQELNEKGNESKILSSCPEIKWHFIGHLQRNKINKLLATPNLHIIETVDSEKIAFSLEEALKKNTIVKTPLTVFVQVNTSKATEKSGCKVEEATSLVDFITKKCPNLKFQGLMTIGEFGYDYSLGPNPDFQSLVSCRKLVSEAFNLDEKTIELSMGMSDDFENAIKVGSTNVRVGSAIFGSR